MTQLRGPVYTRYWPRPDPAGAAVRSQDGVRVNILITLLPGKDQFFGLAGNPNLDWPNPRGPQPNIERRTWLQQTPLNLLGKDAFFGLAGKPNFDWPNPAQLRYARDLRTHVLPSNLPLFTGLGTLTAGLPNYDWPVPRGARRAISLLSNIQQRGSLPFNGVTSRGYIL